MQRLHRNLCEAVVEVLKNIFNEGKYADKAIETLLKSNPKWGARDRAFIAENTYEIVRWWRKLLFVSDEKYTDHYTYRTRVFWMQLGTWLTLQGIELPDEWQEWEGFDQTQIQINNKKTMPLAVRESVPDWLEQLGQHELGQQQWATELKALNQAAQVVLRANTLKTGKKGLIEDLKKDHIHTSTTPYATDAVILKERQNIFRNPLFKEGFFEIQDVGSQKIAEFLRISPDTPLRVVDACAGAGGKTLHLAALMQNKGKIIALDTEAWKLAELKKRSRRAGASIIEIRLIDSSKIVKRLENSADRLLLDVPCTGLGVLRRNPDAKWKLSEAFLHEVRQKQTDILATYPKMLKVGGLMVYATCSLLPSENENQVKTFLEKNPHFSLLEEQKLLPSEYGFDGFYMALLQKNAT